MLCAERFFSQKTVLPKFLSSGFPSKVWSSKRLSFVSKVKFFCENLMIDVSTFSASQHTVLALPDIKYSVQDSLPSTSSFSHHPLVHVLCLSPFSCVFHSPFSPPTLFRSVSHFSCLCHSLRCPALEADKFY